VFKEVLLITVQTWLWFHSVRIRIRPRQSRPILFFVKSIDVYVAELNIALTENCAGNKEYNFWFTKYNLNYGNKMCSLCGNKTM
jgi:hypothetical protein